ncbi:MAG TPA: C4-type zinc ribbon domain-containing protein [Ignavibacteriales bacterium]|nr:C4-type zinc ribbon domain-containing protein [Ignavibacteriales bacterium]
MINRLKTLYELQLIDDQLDELEELRGDLPAAVNELKGRIQSLKDQKEQKQAEQQASIDKRLSNEEEVEHLKGNQKKFKAQLYQVRNNKEYDALTKEIDHIDEEATKLEAQDSALEELIQKLKVEIEDINPQIETLEEELKGKEADLKDIVKANEKEEAKLSTKRQAVEAETKKPDYAAYMRIRKAKGGQAVATIRRSACTGCHNVVPPQRQLEIRQNRRLYNCEYCGRILISAEIADQVETEVK